MDLVVALKSFLRVAETGSFSTAAIDLKLTQSAVSRHVSALEQHYGVRLLHRTTSVLSLTAEGERTIPLARNVLEAIGALDEEVAGVDMAVRGRVRVSLPTPLGLFFSRQLTALLRDHPALDLELILRDRPSALTEEGIDLEVRLGTHADSSLISRRLGWTTARLVAAPSYLGDRAGPTKPADLQDYDCICYDRGSAAERWSFSDGSDHQTIQVRPRLLANSAAAIHQAAVAGAGLAVLSHLLADEDIAAGRLIPLMSSYPPARVAISAVYPSRRHLPARLRVVLDHLVAIVENDNAMGSVSSQGQALSITPGTAGEK